LSVEESRNDANAVAVVGLACRLPGANSASEFWLNLREGNESISFFSEDELRAAGIDPAQFRERSYVAAKGVLAEADSFDAGFFGFSPREASLMDPQQRAFLECAWTALEDAGYDGRDYPGAIGVFAGGILSTYLLRNLWPNQGLVSAAGTFQTAVGNDMTFLASRAAYHLNLRGPSVSVGTACSTSLVAVHMACQSLLSYESDMALAGGVSVHIPLVCGYRYEEGGILSPDGHCRPFDAAAQGTVSSDGVGVVALKRLADAVADGDFIYAVVRGSAVNNDGNQKVGYTAPSVEGQARVIAEALAMAGVEPRTISLVETHGAGTLLGDPIEFAALVEAFDDCEGETGFCALGSVKSNIGHVDAAAGIAGFIKTVLALRHREIPPTLFFKQANPQIDLDHTPFYVNGELRAFKAGESPLRAGVSSFGIGGTNAHVVLEEAPRTAAEPDRKHATAVSDREHTTAEPKREHMTVEPDRKQQARPFELLLLSARTPSALEAATDRLTVHLERNPDVDFRDAAYTLRRGRRAFEHRRFLVCRNRDEAVASLRERDTQRLASSVVRSERRLVTFMFPGLGDHYPAMGWELYCTEREYRDTIDRCAELLRGHLDGDIRDFLYAGRDWSSPSLDDAAGTQQGSDPALDLRAMLASARGTNGRGAVPDQPATAQPAIFVTEVALATLLRSWGIEPEAFIGHSIGEFAAAHLSGVLSLADALALVAARARLIQSRVKPGAMVAVPLREVELREMLPAGVSLGAINGTALCVASGAEAGVVELEARLREAGVSCQRLRSTHAYHSQMMEPIVEPLIDVLKRIELSPPTIPYVSCITGTWITDEEATDPAYWAQHLCRTVRFQDGLARLLEDSRRVLIEVGPGQGLTSHAVRERARVPGLESQEVATMRWSYDRQSEFAVLLRGVGQLWLAGVPFDASRFLAREEQRRVPLPTYPFERQRYWIDPPVSGQGEVADTAPLKKPDVADWFYLPSWKPSVRPRARQSAEVRSSEVRSGEERSSEMRSSEMCSSEMRSDEGRAGKGRVDEEKRRWLVFTDACGVGDDLADELRARGDSVTTVAAGGGFRNDGDGFVIDATRGEDYEELVRQLSESGRAPDSVIHLWCLTREESTTPSRRRFERLQELGYYSVMRLLRSLWRQGAGGSLRLEIVANHLYEVNDGEELIPEKATLRGPAMVAPQEHPGLVCRCMDTDIPPDERPRRAALIEQLLGEIEGEATETAVAYRRGRRYVHKYEPVRLEAVAEGRFPFRPRGVYLLTGGLGGVGLALARHLAETAQARLALVGRSEFPERDDWESWLGEHEERDPVSTKIRQLRAIEELGSEVLVLRADVASREEMSRAVAAVEERFGGLHGVIHAAGSVGVQTFREISQANTSESEAQFAAKVHGLLVLSQVIAERPLDFCMLTSSLSAILGGLGFAAYSAANLFMDSFARWSSRSGGTPWTSVDWDSWRLTDVRPVIAGLGATVSEYVMEPGQAGEAFDRILAEGNLGQVVVSSGDLHARLRQWIARDQMPERTHDNAPTYARPNLSAPYAAPRGELEFELAEVWQELFGIAPLGIHDNFFELGGHSLLATQLSARLYSKLQVEMSLATLLQAPTIAELAVAVVASQAESADPAALESLLAEIGQMSGDELQRLLAAQDSPQDSPQPTVGDDD
jgi:phthiocerol/phenolphthiocerol synthesis type-I polyketide synthase E